MLITSSHSGGVVVTQTPIHVPYRPGRIAAGAVVNPDTGSSAVVRKTGPHQWVVELLSPVSIPWHGETRRGRWSIVLYVEFETWEQALAKAVEWKVAGKVDHIVYDERDKEAG